MIKFSVIIPLYNGAEFISETLDSVVSQTYKNYEIVLVNDGSPDNVGQIVQEYIGQHPGVNFKYIEQENKGLGGARNTAICSATGEIIAILDQDDIWYPKKLELVAKVYTERPEVDVVCHDLNSRKNGVIIKEIICGPGSNDIYRDLLFESNCFSTPAVTFKKALVEKVGYFSEDRENIHLSEDYDLWLRFAGQGCEFYFLHEILGEHVRHGSNYSMNNIDRMVVSGVNVLNRHFHQMKNKKPFDYLRHLRRKAKIYYNAACLYRKTSLKETIVNFIRAFMHDPSIFIKLNLHKINPMLNRERHVKTHKGERN